MAIILSPAKLHLLPTDTPKQPAVVFPVDDSATRQAITLPICISSRKKSTIGAEQAIARIVSRLVPIASVRIILFQISKLPVGLISIEPLYWLSMPKPIAPKNTLFPLKLRKPNSVCFISQGAVGS